MPAELDAGDHLLADVAALLVVNGVFQTGLGQDHALVEVGTIDRGARFQAQRLGGLAPDRPQRLAAGHL